MRSSFSKLSILGVLLLILASCGSKKGTVQTRKQDGQKRPEVIIKSEPEEVPKVVVPDTPDEKPRDAVESYVFKFRDVAMREMRYYGIPASITLAQGILESGSGKGRLAREANNHFGIKCHKGWTGGRIYHDDDRDQECFRVYSMAAESYEDHSIFLSQRKRYAFLFDLDIMDYKAWARGLRKAGYATDRRYPQKLISLIERYDLDKYDRMVGGKQGGQPDRKVREIVSSYTVQAGDTLYSIARRHGTTVEQLIKQNDLDGTDIHPGQRLEIIKNN